MADGPDVGIERDRARIGFDGAGVRDRAEGAVGTVVLTGPM